ncbi:SIS domain-containing protein [Filibacter tadaridae]|uniref:Tagatose-6-phosphate ketose/aldose isomerase n=1 Tax=Filibacter tadaridae TaxID=2483811 RepID=A0A3P5WTS1_9BACL|nr:SIS domain-containing protein [Filibacter tadaridae]VDC25065.1 Putative tagatose-6-phosphate ketose/aldose isomerase [Filibacter tadaridae]
MFNLTLEQINESNAIHTTTEIHQQPAVWQELVTDLFEQQESYKTFLDSIYIKHPTVRVILTGAGTSAFVGDTLVPELARQNQQNIQFESIPTTDIVSNPTAYLFKDTPTILVSFARSGNSPESVATVTLGQEIVTDFYQVVITCNKDGQLAKNIQGDDKSITLLMPEKANDQSLAMTSSFTSMTIAAYMLFTENVFTKDVAHQIIDSAEQLMGKIGAPIDEVLEFDFERIVYLGSGLLAQLSHEAALKMLELSGGQVVAIHESSLGFRHGPKSILTDKSAVVLFMSQDPYTRKYDLDILRELAAVQSGMKIIVLTETNDEEVEKLADWVISVNAGTEPISNDFHLALLYVVFAQALALKKSIQLGITPDNPSPDGAISRVVKGVTIYDYKE